MWRLVKISEQTYFIYCNVNSTKEDVTLILYDLKETWSQTLALRDIKIKVKLLNKRFDFNEDNIKDAFTSGDIQNAVLEEQPNTSDQSKENCVLKLKYRVKNCLLTYDWNLRKQTAEEFQQTFIQPLLRSLLGCYQQVEVLSEIIRKKDAELKQYKMEGAVLSRKTLATKPFDFEDFNKKFECSAKIAIDFRELAKYIQETPVAKDAIDVKDHQSDTKQIEGAIKPEEKSAVAQNAQTKLSPQQRKRRAKDIKMHQLEKHLKIRKRGLAYESSESQTTSAGNSQTTQATDEEEEEREQTSKLHAKSDGERKATTQRNNTRCAPNKNKQDHKSGEDKTDSENENNTRSLRERKPLRSGVNSPKDRGTNSSTKQSITTPRNNSTGTTLEKCFKLRNNAETNETKETKSIESILEGSTIFDFSSQSEDDKPLKDRIKPQKNARHPCKKTPVEDNQRDATIVLLTSPSSSDNEDDKRLQVKSNKSKIPLVRIKTQNKSPAKENVSITSFVTLAASSRIKNLSRSPSTVVIDDLSSQLSNIKKELECLEAMRLADLKQRMCKA